MHRFVVARYKFYNDEERLMKFFSEDVFKDTNDAEFQSIRGCDKTHVVFSIRDRLNLFPRVFRNALPENTGGFETKNASED